MHEMVQSGRSLHVQLMRRQNQDGVLRLRNDTLS